MIKFPEAIDGDDNLYLVHDSLRLVLAEDYFVGQTSIVVEGTEEVFSRFPDTGIITLTEQCSDPQYRSISFFYNGKGDFTFLNLQLLPNFVDSYKPKRLTNVIQSVMAEHHNSLKDALMAIQNFVGIKGQVSSTPLNGTMEARINFLRNLVLSPRAWFRADKRIGIIPLCINFEDFSTRSPDEWDWDFGDSTGASIIRSSSISNGNISKCYYTPGIYPVTLKVINDFGNNSITIQDYITARVEAPDPVTIEFLNTSDQILSGGVLRTRTERPVTIDILTNGENPLDPIVRYIWDLQDDLSHNTSDQTVASYSVGGYYDVKVRTETFLGAYRSTEFFNSIDVVEKTNLWHFIFDPSSPDSAITKTLYSYEFGLISELYKNASLSTINVTRNYLFLGGKPEESQQKREFRRNNGFSTINSVTSGDAGNCMIYWASGAAADNIPQYIDFMEFDGFNGTYSSPLINSTSNQYPRYWNWLSLASSSQIHFLLGLPGIYPQPAGSPTNLDQDTVYLNNFAVSTVPFVAGNLLNGAIDLQENPGNGADGDFSVYRATWKNPNGYFLRNDGGGDFFRIISFYQTESITIGQEIENIRKLNNMPGFTKKEGQLVTLASGIYFFGNYGEVTVYDPINNLWLTGGPGLNSPQFKSLQDITVSGYDNPDNTLIATTDNDRRAYLFFDYSPAANILFDDIGRIFRQLPVRPLGEQFLAGIY